MTFNLAEIFPSFARPVSESRRNCTSELADIFDESWREFPGDWGPLKPFAWTAGMGFIVVGCIACAVMDRGVAPFLEAVCDVADEVDKMLQRAGDKWVKSGGEQFALTSFSRVSSFAEVCDAVSRGYDSMSRSPDTCGDNRSPPSG